MIGMTKHMGFLSSLKPLLNRLLENEFQQNQSGPNLENGPEEQRLGNQSLRPGRDI